MYNFTRQPGREFSLTGVNSLVSASPAKAKTRYLVIENDSAGKVRARVEETEVAGCRNGRCSI